MQTDKKIRRKMVVATYYTLPRALIQDVVGVKDDRQMRRWLQQDVSDGLLNRTHTEVWNPDNKSGPTAVYFPSREGLRFLSIHTGDDSWLTKCCLTPNWQHLYHWVEVARFRILFDRAVGTRPDLTSGGCYGEWEVIDGSAKEPEKRYRVYTKITEKPKLVFAPDAAMLLVQGAKRKIAYLEMDRGTVSVSQVCASKAGGTAGMFKKQLHKRHFDGVSDRFWVLSVSYSAKRRDHLVEEFRKKKADEAGLWRFASWHELTPERLLTAPVWHSVAGETAPLIKIAARPDAEANGVSNACPASVHPSQLTNRAGV
jgi:hypothetical protein